MKNTFASVSRHLSIKTLISLGVGNIVCALPFLAALGLPIVFSQDPSLGFGALVVGFLLTGLAIATAGRYLDSRSWSAPKTTLTLRTALSRGWAEGLLVTAALLGGFTLLFQSLPFYLSQGGPLSIVSLLTLAAGSALVAAAAPYYLPIRRREGLGLLKASIRAYNLMKSRPLLSLTILGVGLGSVLASIATLGMFPGFVGLAAIHQGAYDHAVKASAVEWENPEIEE